MTDLLGKAFEFASRLPDQQQDAIAKWILEELESEERWDRNFEKSASFLSKLANGALTEHAAGRTTPLRPDSL